MLASDLIVQLQNLLIEYGDKNVFHEDNECNTYSLSGVKYNEQEDEFEVV